MASASPLPVGATALRAEAQVLQVGRIRHRQPGRPSLRLERLLEHPEHVDVADDADELAGIGRDDDNGAHLLLEEQ